MRFVLDSNILISALNLNDAFNKESCAILKHLKEINAEIIAPVLQLWELDAYVTHIERAKSHKQNSNIEVKITHYDITSGLYARTYCTEMACVKGADRVFVSLAMEHNVPLITNDTQIHRYSDVFKIKAVSVDEFLRKYF